MYLFNNFHFSVISYKSKIPTLNRCPTTVYCVIFRFNVFLPVDIKAEEFIELIFNVGVTSNQVDDNLLLPQCLIIIIRFAVMLNAQFRNRTKNTFMIGKFYESSFPNIVRGYLYGVGK